jgi:hypothetical protein
VNELEFGTLFMFADWPTSHVPRKVAGVYTVWRGEQFLYVGMSGRKEGQANWLRDRLGSHASGKRSGDQFNVYVCDRFVVPELDREQQLRIGSGDLKLDDMTKAFIIEHLGFRFAVCRDGKDAASLERDIRAGSLPAGLPYLNPLTR